MPKSTRSFKVIIVGGSIVGLITALALEKAGIDYVVLERGEIAPHLGASISIFPHTQRVMEQLGIWEEIRAGIIPLKDRYHYDQYGQLLESSAVLREISKMSLNRFTSFMERRFWLNCIYNGIQNKPKVLPHTSVTSFRETEDGVEVTTKEGKIIQGDILLGADGINSTIRNLMASHIARTDATTSEEMRSGFTADYRCVFGTSRNYSPSDKDKPLLPGGMCHNVYYRGFSGASAAGAEDLIFWFLFVKSDHATKTPNTPRYTEEESEATINKYGGYAVGPGYTFKDLWESRVRAAMVPLEEGVLKPKWNTGGRVALMGDAVHKSTVNPGLGGNLAVEGIVHLMNELVPLVRKCESDGGRKPTKSELVAVFDRYEVKQRPHANFIVAFSAYVKKYDAMETWWLRVLLRVSPWISDKYKAGRLVSYMNEAPWLNFLPNPDEKGKANGTQ